MVDGHGSAVAGSGALSAVAAITAGDTLKHIDELTCTLNLSPDEEEDGAPANAPMRSKDIASFPAGLGKRNP